MQGPGSPCVEGGGVVAPVVRGVSIEPVLEQWAHHLEAKNRDEKYIKQQQRAIRMLLEHSKASRLEHLTGAMIYAYRDDAMLSGSSGSKVNNQLSAFRQFFKWAIRFEVLKQNPARDIENVARNDGDGNREFTPLEASSMIQAARADEARAVPVYGAIRSPAYIVAWNTGLRHKEMSRIRARDVRGLGSSDAYIELPWTAAKSRRAVQIPLNLEAAAELAKWVPRVDPLDLLFPTRKTPGLPQLPHDRVVDADIKAAGIAKKDEWGAPVGFHSFRKGGATALAASGAPETQVAQFLRHSDPKLTRKVYIRLRRQQLGAVAGSVPSVDSAPAKNKSEVSSCKGADSGDTQGVTHPNTQNPTTSRPRPFGQGCVTNNQPEGPGRGVVPSGSRVSGHLPTPKIAGVGFEPAPANAGVGAGITLNLTVSPAAIGAFIRALLEAQEPQHVSQQQQAG